LNWAPRIHLRANLVLVDQHVRMRQSTEALDLMALGIGPLAQLGLVDAIRDTLFNGRAQAFLEPVHLIVQLSANHLVEEGDKL